VYEKAVFSVHDTSDREHCWKGRDVVLMYFLIKQLKKVLLHHYYTQEWYLNHIISQSHHIISQTKYLPSIFYYTPVIKDICMKIKL